MIEKINVSELVPYDKNSRTHTEQQINQIVKSIKEFGFTNPVLVDKDNGIIAGHARVQAANKMGMASVPCIRLSNLTPAQKRAYVIADNKLALNAGWNNENLKIEMEELRIAGFDLNLTGFDEMEIASLIGDADYDEKKKGVLAEKFIIPPFSVLDTRTKLWLDRREKWDKFNFDSLKGRDSNLTFSVSAQPPSVYEKKNKYEKLIGKKISWDEFIENNKDLKLANSTSKFDPVLCELIYRWFCPVGGTVVDPFSGGSVRGLVASILGFNYFGVDIREDQVNENISQTENIKSIMSGKCVWECGDSTNEKMAFPECDLFFSCPPYHDLEEYSDFDADISNMDYEKFISMLGVSVSKGFNSLRENRFACFVVTELRKKDGGYKGFVSDTINVFKKSGFVFYNDIVLVNQCSSAAIRTGRQFDQSRKVGKIHQNVLVFVKGDPREATKLCGLTNSKECISIFLENDDKQLNGLAL